MNGTYYGTYNALQTYDHYASTGLFYSIPPLRKKRTERKLIAWRYIYTNYLILVFRSTSFGRYVVERGIVRTTKSFCKRLEWNKRRNRKRKKRTKGEDRVPSGS